MIEIVLREFASAAQWEAAMRRRPDAVFVCAGKRKRGVPPGIGRGGARVELTIDATLVALALLSRPGGLTTGEIVELVWGDRADGGPEFAANCATRLRGIARHALAAIGFGVTSRRGQRIARAFEVGAAAGEMRDSA
jgi:hypothetical protein